MLARACAIFKIDTIYVYNEGNNGSDGSFMTMILRYLETPQFLRRRLFQKVYFKKLTSGKEDCVREGDAFRD